MSHESSVIPSISSVINSVDPKKKKELLIVKQESHDVSDSEEIKEVSNKCVSNKNNSGPKVVPCGAS